MISNSTKKIKAAITAIGGYVPEDFISNKDLEKMVDTNDEWITARTGIKKRRILKEKGKATSYLAIKAANDLIKKKKLEPDTIDLVIVSTITPDFHGASTSPTVASQINASNAYAFDINAACSGFLYGMSTATSYIESGRYKKVLLIGADMMSSIVDYTDRSTSILFGDGAGAVLIEPSKNEFGWEDEFLRSDGVGAEWLKIKAGGSLYPTSKETFEKKWHYITQDGKTVFKSAVSEMANATEQIIIRNKLDPNDIKYLLPHQANKRIIDATAEKINLDKNKVLMNIEEYGNTTAATIPLLMHDYESNFKKGDKIILAAFGAGLTWGAAYLTWAYN
ncbi:ketoacyl-ACP synthase III [Flavobacteriaceae bacterium]|nr:ketoacyl-ACP synthase III [Flavobacteriaceae bacterium]MDC3040685.1 ketoacyl-ACP synthase III [Flavobacteriaceae bacterium]